VSRDPFAIGRTILQRASDSDLADFTARTVNNGWSFRNRWRTARL